MAVKILAVDDEKNILKLIKTALEKDGYLVYTESDPEKAVQESFAEYDLILLDVMMPGMDGFQLLKALQEEVITQHIPVVLITSLGRGGCDPGTRAGRRRLYYEALWDRGAAGQSTGTCKKRTQRKKICGFY